MTKAEYILLGELTDSLEWCFDQLEEIDPEDARVIENILAEANKKIEAGY